MAKQQRQYAAIPEPTTDVAALLKTVAALKQNVEVLCGMRRAGAGIADQLTDLISSTGRINARFTEYVEVSTGNNVALARRMTTLEADMYGSTGRITLLEEARVNAENALAQRALTLETDMYDNTGRVSTIERAYSDADTALAEQITELRTIADGGTAGGRIAFRANAGPSGYSASYDLTLTATATGGPEAFTGMSILTAVGSGGAITSSIAFTARSFMLYDPTYGPTPVFIYQSGVFRFNVPVEITTGDIAHRAITVPMFSRNSNDVGGGQAEVIINISGTDTLVDIYADFDGQPYTTFPYTSANQTLTLTRVRSDGLHNAVVQEKNIPFNVSGNNENRVVAFMYVGMSAQDMPPTSGDYTYQITTSHGYGPVTLKILAAKR